MEIRNYGSKKILIADNNCRIKSVGDIYEAEHKDEDGNLIPEHFPYYSAVIFLADNFNEDRLHELYVEEKIEKE